MSTRLAPPNPGPFPNGGDIGALMAGLDAANSPLGPVSDWPVALRNAVALLLPAGAEIVLFWGPDYVALYNDAYAPTIGTKHPAALGRPAREAWAELWGDLEPLLRNVRETGVTFSDKDRAFYMERHGYGETIYFDISYSAVPDDDGSVGGVLCIVSETTDRVRAARSVAIERARLAQMFDQAPGFMAVLRQPGHVYELLNASYLQLTGHRDLLGKPVREALPELAGQGYFELLDRVAATGKTHREMGARVALQRTADGPVEDRFVDFVFQPVTDTDGKVTAIFVEGSDVTERRQMMEELRESETRFRQLADTAPALIWVTDESGELVFASQGFETLLGVPADEMLGRGWRTLIVPEEWPAFAERQRAGFDRRQQWSGDLKLVDRRGAVRWMHAEGRPRVLDGEFRGYVGCAVDVTEAHLASETLERMVAERTAELGAANRALTAQIGEREAVEATLHRMQRLEAVGQLTSGVAHDFNNLLTVVLGNIGMIDRTARDRGLDARTLQRVDHIRTAAERGAALTAQLLAFSRRQRLEAKPIDLNVTVAGMSELMASSIGNAITIRTELAPDLWPALVDPTQVELIILNLAINARDAMKVGGTVTVSTSNVTRGDPQSPEEPPRGDHVLVAVSDTGTGMTEDVLAKAFEPFFTTKEVGRGSGLGLAQVYGFVKQSGGGVRIETKVGEGTRICVYLPRSRAAADDGIAAPAGDERSIAGATILVVDDEPEVRIVTADTLSDAGCTVIEAGSGNEALAILAGRADIDLVVADFAMPAMNGAELARRVATRWPALPFLVVTGYADLTAIADVADDAVIQKPFKPADLRARIHKALQ